MALAFLSKAKSGDHLLLLLSLSSSSTTTTTTTTTTRGRGRGLEGKSLKANKSLFPTSSSSLIPANTNSRRAIPYFAIPETPPAAKWDGLNCSIKFSGLGIRRTSLCPNPSFPKFVSRMAGSQDQGEGKGIPNGEKQKEPGLLTIPTMLTLGRVAAIPLLVATFYMNNWWATTATTSIFVVAAATDWLDGYMARKMKLRSAFGAFLDPVADKLMVATTLVLLCSKPLEVPLLGSSSWLLTIPSIIIIGREITMSAVREWAASQDTSILKAVAVNNLGKWKTAAQMTSLTLLLAARDSSLPGGTPLTLSGVALLYISSGLTLLSLVSYIKGIWRVLLK